jgi:glutamine amidotransferase
MIAVIDGGGANFLSVTTALDKLKIDYQFTHDADVINLATGVILPGVGSAKYAMEHLKKHGLVDVVRNLKTPLLGICLGMQLLYEHSTEGDVHCLGVISGTVNRFTPEANLIVPHMGWNNLNVEVHSPLINALGQDDNVYFVHSFYAPVNEATIASCDYGNRFSAIVQNNNFYGMQFHPEKSGVLGELLLSNFFGIVNDSLSSN